MLPLHRTDTNVRSFMSVTESCRSPFGHLQPFWIASMAVAQPIVAAHPKRTFHPQGHLDRDCQGLSDARVTAAMGGFRTFRARDWKGSPRLARHMCRGYCVSIINRTIACLRGARAHGHDAPCHARRCRRVRPDLL